jgi:hypothetical protein
VSKKSKTMIQSTAIYGCGCGKPKPTRPIGKPKKQ